MPRLYHVLKFGAGWADLGVVTAFSPTEWLLLGLIASFGVLACLRLLASEVNGELKLHGVRVRAAQLRIEHIRAMRGSDEVIGVDIIEDEPDDDVEVLEESTASDGADAEAISDEPIPAAA